MEMMEENTSVITKAMSGAWAVPFIVFFGVIVYLAATIEPLSAPVPLPVEEAREEVTLPVTWGDIGKRMVEAGVIDAQKLETLYARRGGLGPRERALLSGNQDAVIVMTEENAGVLLNLFWGFGLANRNAVLESGPISNPAYGSPSRFASTGGFTLAAGNPMNHFNQHLFIPLGPEEQSLVERVAENIYRPCCNNPTHFPDCNHGMAMLGLLELMAANGAGEEEMYGLALAVNRLWFPGEYETIEKFLEQNDLSLEDVSPQVVLGKEFSSGSGFARVVAALETPAEPALGGSCSA